MPLLERAPRRFPARSAGQVGSEGGQSTAFRVACRMLRTAGKLNMSDLPPAKRGESLIDWLVRAGVAPNAHQAAEGLIVAQNLAALRDEVLREIEPAGL